MFVNNEMLKIIIHFENFYRKIKLKPAMIFETTMIIKLKTKLFQFLI